MTSLVVSPVSTVAGNTFLGLDVTVVNLRNQHVVNVEVVSVACLLGGQAQVILRSDVALDSVAVLVLNVLGVLNSHGINDVTALKLRILQPQVTDVIVVELELDDPQASLVTLSGTSDVTLTGVLLNINNLNKTGIDDILTLRVQQGELSLLQISVGRANANEDRVLIAAIAAVLEVEVVSVAFGLTLNLVTLGIVNVVADVLSGELPLSGLQTLTSFVEEVGSLIDTLLNGVHEVQLVVEVVIAIGIAILLTIGVGSLTILVSLSHVLVGEEVDSGNHAQDLTVGIVGSLSNGLNESLGLLDLGSEVVNRDSVVSLEEVLDGSETTGQRGLVSSVGSSLELTLQVSQVSSHLVDRVVQQLVSSLVLVLQVSSQNLILSLGHRVSVLNQSKGSNSNQSLAVLSQVGTVSIHLGGQTVDESLILSGLVVDEGLDVVSLHVALQSLADGRAELLGNLSSNSLGNDVLLKALDQLGNGQLVDGLDSLLVNGNLRLQSLDSLLAGLGLFAQVTGQLRLGSLQSVANLLVLSSQLGELAVDSHEVSLVGSHVGLQSSDVGLVGLDAGVQLGNLTVNLVVDGGQVVSNGLLQGSQRSVGALQVGSSLVGSGLSLLSLGQSVGSLSLGVCDTVFQLLVSLGQLQDVVALALQQSVGSGLSVLQVVDGLLQVGIGSLQVHNLLLERRDV